MQSIRQIFEDHGLRCTRQREQIYQVLAHSKSHPTADEIYNQVRCCEPGLSLATVYNTLEAFTASGLVRRIAAPGSGPCRYDADTTDHVHITTPDGRVLDLPPDLSERVLQHLPSELLAEVESRTGLKVGGVNVHVVAREHPAG